MGRALIAAAILGVLALFWGGRMRSGQAGRNGIRQMVGLGSSLAEQDTPALATSLTALVQGDLTRRVHISTQPLSIEKNRSGQELPRSLNAILASLQECARSYNWITDPACNRLFYIGTDSFQEGQIAGEAMGRQSGGRGKVVVVGAFNQDNLVLRKNGFQNALLEKFPGISVAEVLDAAQFTGLELCDRLRACCRQWPDLVGVYAAEIESLKSVVACVQQEGKQGKLKIISHDLTDEISRLIQDGSITGTITQNPFAQGYDPVIHLYNHLVANWQAPVQRMLIQPEMVSRENLNQHWQVGRGAVQSKESLAQRPQPALQKPSKKIKIAMVSLDVTFFNQVKQGMTAAVRALQDRNVQVDWCIPEGASTEKGVVVSASLYGPFLEKLVAQGYHAIGICVADSELIPYINRIVKQGIPVATFNAEPGSLRGLMVMLMERAASTLEASQRLSSASRETNAASGQVARTILHITESINQEATMMSKARESVQNIAASIQQVSQGANEQAQAAGEAVSASDQITRAVQSTSQAIQMVNEAAATSVKIAENGALAVSQTMNQMNNIQQAVETSSQSIQKMENYSRQIGEMVETIQDIADQTNLLALNAAIEAARAGAEGRGFAVVAAEVRKLAEKSLTASKEVGGIVRTIQSGISEVVVSMQVANQQVQEGNSLAANSGEALQQLQVSATEMLAQVSTAQKYNSEMVQVVDQINTAIQQVSTVIEKNYASTLEISQHSNQTLQIIESVAELSEENAASTEQISASTEELSAEVGEMNHSVETLETIARELRTSLARFKLHE